MRTKYYLSFALILLLSPTALAQSNERDLEKEGLIWQRLQSIAPRSVETFKAATVALDEGDYEKAARLYEAVFKMAPDFDPVMRRLGISLVEMGRRQEGMDMLERAVNKVRSPENLISLAQYLAFPGGDKRGAETGHGARPVAGKRGRRPKHGQ